MCQQCYPAVLPPLEERRVPPSSGEAAIYSPEYLERKEGNKLGTQPELWRSYTF